MTVEAVHSVLEGLVAGMVDYAGLFPPAGLSMAEAVANYATYSRSRDHWALGRFVLPASRLSEFSALAAEHVDDSTDARPWRLSVLLKEPADAAVVEPFNARWAPRVSIDAVEAAGATNNEIVSLASVAPPGVFLYVELRPDADLTHCLRALRTVGAAAKIRTGGVTPEAFPAPEVVVRFIRGCIAAAVPFKATAGLHHALRGPYRLTYAPDSAVGEMYGFLNVIACTAALRAGASPEEAQRVLVAGGHDLVVTTEGITWSGVTLSVAQLAGAREVIRGFGSCSFREPVDELAALSGKRS